MYKKIKILLIVELLLVFALLFTLSHRVIVPFVLLILFGSLAKITQHRFFKVIAIIPLIIIILMVMTSIWFWALILVPIITLIVLYKNNPQAFQQGRTYQGFTQGRPAQHPEPKEAERISEGNEVIDLADLVFHAGGNDLQIKKNTGNTKIIVPEGVEVAIKAQVINGVVKIFEQAAEVNEVNTRYFSENYESAEKRVAITIQVVTGNVEVLRA